MKERFLSSNPFSQVTILMVIGAVSFLILSIAISLLGSFLYPGTAEMEAMEMAKHHPVLFMLVNYLPFQIGFFLIPATLYILWLKPLENTIHKPRFDKVIWSALLFITAVLLLPFLTQINIDIIANFGWKERLLADKEASDKFLMTLIGEVGSASFYVAVLLVGVLTGIAEELAFRRFLFRHLLRNSQNFGLSLFLSAFIFAILHFNYIQIIPLIGFGIAFGLMYYVSGTIWVGVFFHALNNILNVYWLATDTFPTWLSEMDVRVSIPATIIMLGLLIYFTQKIKVLKPENS